MKLISKEQLNIKKINNQEYLKDINNEIINEENLSVYFHKINNEDQEENIQHNESIVDSVMNKFIELLNTPESQAKIMDIITKNQNLLNSLANKFMQAFTIKIEKKSGN